jgi:hypothetical protein
MKFQLRQHGWPIGQHLIPEGTIIDTDAGDQWSRLAVGLNPPINAQPLDQATYDAMKAIYPAERIITVPGADGINRT